MKIALLIQCHCLPEQINEIINILCCEEITFFIHVDKKSNIKDKIIKKEHVIFVPDDDRIDVRWSQISQVDATLKLLKTSLAYGKYDYFWICSGQDFPIKNREYILEFFEKNKNKEFINLFESKSITGKSNNYDKRNEIIYPTFLLNKTRKIRIIRRLYIELTGGYNHTWSFFKRTPVLGLDFYFGSSWWCLSTNMIEWIILYLDNNPQYYEFFSKSICADESFFQTLVMNSPYKNNRADYLHYIDWRGCKNSPKDLTISDYEDIIRSEYLMARKCNMNSDNGLVKKLMSDLL